MITHDEAVNLAKMYGRAMATQDRETSERTTRLLKQYLMQNGSMPSYKLLRVAHRAADLVHNFTNDDPESDNAHVSP